MKGISHFTLLTAVGTEKIAYKARNDSSNELIHEIDGELDMYAINLRGQVSSGTKLKK